MVTHDVDEALLRSDRVVMMTNGPRVRMGEDLRINVDRPRDRLALAAHLRQAAYRAQLPEFLHRKQAKGGA